MRGDYTLVPADDCMQIAHINFSPLIVTLLATPDANTGYSLRCFGFYIPHLDLARRCSSGLLVDISDEVKSVLAPLQSAISSHS